MVNVEPSPGSLVTSIVAAQHAREMLGDGETQPGAAEIARGRRIGLGEGLEQPAICSGGHADAAVGDLEVDLRRRRSPSARATRAASTVPLLVNLAALLNRLIRLCLSLVTSVLQLADVGRAIDHRALPFLPTSGSTMVLHLVDQPRQRHVLEIQVHAAGFDLRQVEDVVDQAEQMLAGGLDLLQVGQRRLVAAIDRVLLRASGCSR